ncbi:sensor histidine kinase [Bacteroidota bacterium]
MLNPFTQNRSSLVFYSIVWICISIEQLIILQFILQIQLEHAIIDSIVYNILYYIIGLSLWYPLRYVTIDEKQIWKAVSNHFIGAIVTSVIWIYSGYFILNNWIGEESTYKVFLNDSLIWRFNVGILFYIIIITLYYVVYYYKNFKEKLHRESQLKTLVKEAELKSLKYQINPHFIFNSLNSISALTSSNSAKAREMTIKLSSFLRNTLSQNEKQMNKLKDEINSVKLYMEIEKIRFDDNLEFIEENCNNFSNYLIPSMILQPLLENAIKHGVYESIEKIYIKLSCKFENNYLKLTVQNNFDPDALSKKGKGIGLNNISQRLKLLYNQENLLVYTKQDKIFIVHIFIPIKDTIEI